MKKKLMISTIFGVLLPAFLGLMLPAFPRAQSLHSLSPRSNLDQPQRPRFATPQATRSWVYPDPAGRQKPRGQPGRSVTWLGFSLTPKPSVLPVPTKTPVNKISHMKNKLREEPKKKWYSLGATPTPMAFKSKIKPLQPMKNQPIKVPTFSAWNMKFMKNQGSIYQGKDGKAASILMRMTPTAGPEGGP